VLELRSVRIVLYLALLFVGMGFGASEDAASAITQRGTFVAAAAPVADAGGWTTSYTAEKVVLDARCTRSIDLRIGSTTKTPPRIRLYRTVRAESNPVFVRLLKGDATRARGLERQQLDFAAYHCAARNGYYSSHTTTPPPPSRA
jgi:hypothetical protein